MENLNTTTTETVEVTETAAIDSAPASESKKAKKSKKVSGEPKPKKEKKVKVATAPKVYPFDSKRAIIARIDSDDTAAVAALVQIHSLDSAMCSQKKQFATLAARAAELGDGATQDAEFVGQCRALARKYGRRLAVEARKAELARNPELAPLATLFSANVVA